MLVLDGGNIKLQYSTEGLSASWKNQLLSFLLTASSVLNSAPPGVTVQVLDNKQTQQADTDAAEATFSEAESASSRSVGFTCIAFDKLLRNLSVHSPRSDNNTNRL